MRRPHHKLLRVVTRLLQMTASCFYPSHLLHDTCHKHSEPSCSLYHTQNLICCLFLGKLFREAHFERSAQKIRGHELRIPLIYWHWVNIALTSVKENTETTNTEVCVCIYHVAEIGVIELETKMTQDYQCKHEVVMHTYWNQSWSLHKSALCCNRSVKWACYFLIFAHSSLCIITSIIFISRFCCHNLTC